MTDCSPDLIKEALLKFVVQLISHKQMHQVKKLFFVPVGLPGMGKSTLAKHIRQAIQKNFQAGNQDSGVTLLSSKREVDHIFKQSNGKNYVESNYLPQVSFKKISYDRIIGENVKEFQKTHPETPFHEIIDIIRSKAD